jgi:hypothetical protein
MFSQTGESTNTILCVCKTLLLKATVNQWKHKITRFDIEENDEKMSFYGK